MDETEIFTYLVALPRKINEMVTLCNGGVTIYIDKNLSAEKQKEVYLHAVRHFLNNDFEKTDVQEIEADAHNNERRSRK